MTFILSGAAFWQGRVLCYRDLVSPNTNLHLFLCCAMSIRLKFPEKHLLRFPRPAREAL